MHLLGPRNKNIVSCWRSQDLHSPFIRDAVILHNKKWCVGKSKPARWGKAKCKPSHGRKVVELAHTIPQSLHLMRICLYHTFYHIPLCSAADCGLVCTKQLGHGRLDGALDSFSRSTSFQFISTAYPLTTTPPLGCRLWPEIKLLSWLARKTKHVATSLGCPGRPIGVPLNCSWAEVFMVAGIRGVQTMLLLAFTQSCLWISTLTWSRTHAIHPDSILDLLVGQRPGKRNDCSLCWRVVK